VEIQKFSLRAAVEKGSYTMPELIIIISRVAAIFSQFAW
jgi:hypothetical protein